MKKIFSFVLLITSSYLLAQAGAPASPYYNGFNFSQSGTALKNALATKITTTHTNLLSYSQAENAIEKVDLDPTDFSNVNLLLVYGFSATMCPASTADDIDHRRRNKFSEDQGTNDPCLWNKEHTYPKALGIPDLGTSGPGSDVHHLRASDKKEMPKGTTINSLMVPGILLKAETYGIPETNGKVTSPE